MKSNIHNLTCKYYFKYTPIKMNYFFATFIPSLATNGAPFAWDTYYAWINRWKINLPMDLMARVTIWPISCSFHSVEWHELQLINLACFSSQSKHSHLLMLCPLFNLNFNKQNTKSRDLYNSVYQVNTNDVQTCLQGTKEHLFNLHIQLASQIEWVIFQKFFSYLKC